MQKNAMYSGMLNGLNRVNLSGRQRAHAETHMRHAAMIIELLLGSFSRKQDSAPAAAQK